MLSNSGVPSLGGELASNLQLNVCLAIGLLWVGAIRSVRAELGPDVIVGDLSSVNDYARLGDTAALTMTTVSCNAGTEAVLWNPLPSNLHPVISQNLYRLHNGRLEQIGQSWLKHGYFALQTTFCYADCEPVADGMSLGPHCSDPYSAAVNQGPNLGPRREVNPVTGYFDGSTANDHAGHVHTTISHGLQVKHADLGIPGARYFVEAHYLAPDDAATGNGNNNASHREVAVTGNSSDWIFTPLSPTVQRQPAIHAWSGAARTVLDSWPEDGRIIIANKVTALGGGVNRFDYAVYNMNSERGIRAFTVPIGGATVSNVGFSAVASHDEGFSNAPWVHTVGSSSITWSSESFIDNPNANAIRWGTMYNFWFETTASGVGSSATLGRFKPGPGSTLIVGWVRAPAPGDCNTNGVADDLDIAGGAADCNFNGLPDECELPFSDCNQNMVPDDCDLSSGGSLDCNGNAQADECDTASGRSPDCNANSIPDECEQSSDCNVNGVPDSCDLVDNDCDANAVPDDCQPDCDLDGIIDPCAGEPDCNNNGVPDSCDVSGVPGGLRIFDSGSIALPIPDGDDLGVSHVLEVPTGGELLDVDVELNIQHTWVSDLVVTLRHEDIEVTLWDGACGSANHMQVTLDDDGGMVLCASPTVGTVAPSSTGGGFLSSYFGTDVRGSWQLHLQDMVSSDPGTLMQWRLLLHTVTIPPTSADVNGSLVPDECEVCATIDECNDADPCTLDDCGAGLCNHAARLFGDVDASGVIDVDDLLCLLNGFSVPGSCPGSDLFPCEGDGLIDIDDLLAGLYAFTGVDVCCGP